jgi:epoxide hydrolase 4
MESRVVSTNGVHLRVWLDGPASGTPVLLLHGFPDFALGWGPQLAALAAAGYRVIAPDQRGYPGSDRPPRLEDYRVSTLVADVLGLLDALGIEQAHLVGHDWGGAVAWSLATDHSERFLTFTVLNMAHPREFGRAIRTSRQVFRSWYIFAFQLPGLEYVLAAGRAELLIQALRAARTGRWSPEQLEAYREAFSDPRVVWGMLAWYRAAVRWPEAPRGRVRLPTLILWGRRDIAESFRMVEPSVARCDQVKLVVYDGAGHFVQHDAAAEVNAELLSHLGR